MLSRIHTHGVAAVLGESKREMEAVIVVLPVDCVVSSPFHATHRFRLRRWRWCSRRSWPVLSCESSETEPTKGGKAVLAAGIGGLGIVGIAVVVLIVLAVFFFVRRA
jgi:hypothetical protein